ncbi:MAG: ArsR family transcriptional regulator [Prevotella sp.]|nr:ArsR family transcriptional regulator [Prevotella sp.]
MKETELTEKELELIYAIRNYRNSYPNGHPELLWYAQQIFDKLVEDHWNDNF